MKQEVVQEELLTGNAGRLGHEDGSWGGSSAAEKCSGGLRRQDRGRKPLVPGMSQPTPAVPQPL